MSLLGPTYAICHCSPLPRSVCQFRVHSFFSLESWWWPISKVRLQNKRHCFTAHACNREAEFIFGRNADTGRKVVEIEKRSTSDRAPRLVVARSHICILQSLTWETIPFFPDINFTRLENKKLYASYCRSTVKADVNIRSAPLSLPSKMFIALHI